ncbi:alpha-L-fucosidase [Rubellicoccus peritrichatus]|uniref:alpha-L-fucosidase n=1 Tax=Rubellicoccus peritrichatus TaxID=3080537 RepID=A0AAQ3LGS3_9BACT|nr:alpha-L-fucosidase [Puniceicoccus sp. CR14]WOO43528.1 alpha-L-fucosidase [Puniceicoccus sp. CR14]
MADPIPDQNNIKLVSTEGTGEQRLSLEKLQAYMQWQYGMFIHWGMSTFDGMDLSACEPIGTYNPTDLNVDEWISVARDAGMRYAVLTAKHVAGHALWPSAYGDYSVKNSSVTTDVVGAFTNACREKGIKAGIYYCAWDNTNLFGMQVTKDWKQYAYGMTRTNDAYREFMWNQCDELIDNYSPDLLWVDMPKVLPLDKRYELYERITNRKPEIYFGYNHSCQNGTEFDPTFAWPSDFMTLERNIPNAHNGHAKQDYFQWKEVLGKNYYIPGETNDTIGREWFYHEDDAVRSDKELLGMYMATTGRNVNFLLNCPPDKRGRMPQRWIDALTRLRKNIDLLNLD